MTSCSTSGQTWQDLVSETTGCKKPARTETVQSLWSGFGEIFRVRAGTQHLIVKQVCPPIESAHPRGWNSDFAIARKLKSYEVETFWYQRYSHLSKVRMAKYIGSRADGPHRILLLEDLDFAGFPLRHASPRLSDVLCCVDWLAGFHAQFLGSTTDSLWPVGTYWHLATRPEEFNAMTNVRLKQFAHKIDRVLTQGKYQTLVHGDAKLANFCFSKASTTAAVDFQYIGGGCGMKDLAYFIGSCFDENECETFEPELLTRYFSTFSKALNNASLSSAIESEWRTLYPVAWTDFYRFLDGWMPSHKKIHRYTRQMAEQTFEMLFE